MKKLLKFLCGRIFITGLLLLLQAVWLGVFFWKLAAYSVWLNAAFTLLSLLIVLHILYHDDVSGFKIGWIILILQLPVMGGLLYLLFGGKLPAHRMRRRLAAQHAETAAALGQDEAVFGALRGDDARAAARSRYITATGGYPVCMDSDVKYYPLGEEMYADMLRALESAEHFIFLEYFIIQPGKMWDGIAEILKRKAAQGVDVRLICDDMGSLFLLPQGFAREMERSGVKTLMFNPFIPVLSLAMNNRDHRKIMDVDGHTVFTGGVNLSDEYINAVELHGHWKDTGVRVTGEAAWNFTAMFLEFWHAYRPESANEPLDAFRPHAYHPAPFAGEGWVQPFSDSPLDELPRLYRDAVVAVEDHRFYSHGGVDFIALCRALWNDVCAGAFVEGGSTITQQLAKNLYFTQEKVLTRKAAEAFMAWAIEKQYTKDEILELYVNSIYFGSGYYNVRQASEGYFGKAPAQMTPYECTLLAGVPNAPSAYDPAQNPGLARQRQKKVVEQMVERGCLSAAQAREALTPG